LGEAILEQFDNRLPPVGNAQPNMAAKPLHPLLEGEVEGLGNPETLRQGDLTPGTTNDLPEGLRVFLGLLGREARFAFRRHELLHDFGAGARVTGEGKR
jgi:hypothetical protein